MRAGIDRTHVRADVRPQDDLFRHVNGRWLDEAEIPPDRAADGAFRKLVDEAEVQLRAIVEEAAAAAERDEALDDEQRKIGELYASFLDTDTVERLGAAPIADDLAAIAAVSDTESLLATVGRLQRDGVAGAFHVWVDTDAKQSDRYIVNCYQGGLGLPDESYYREEQFAQVRGAYVDPCRPHARARRARRPRREGRADRRAGDRAGRRALGPGREPRRDEDLQQARPRRRRAR